MGNRVIWRNRGVGDGSAGVLQADADRIIREEAAPTLSRFWDFARLRWTTRRMLEPSSSPSASRLSPPVLRPFLLGLRFPAVRAVSAEASDHARWARAVDRFSFASVLRTSEPGRFGKKIRIG